MEANKIKIFSSNADPTHVGEILQDKIDEWIDSLGHKIEIIDIHSNSNKYGWMIILTYNEY